MSKAKVRVGIVGAGPIGGLGGRPFSHAAGYRRCDDAELVAIADIDPQRLQQFGDEWEIEPEHRYPTAVDMYEKARLDVVDVTTNPPYHHHPVIEAAQAGIKVVMVENPPATNLLYGLKEALAMLREEGLPQVFARHARHAEATRRAVRAWGLEILCAVPEEYSDSITAVMMPSGHDADRVRSVVLDRFDMSLGVGLTKLAGRVFRIGHLGDLNDLSLLGTLAGVEMGLKLSDAPVAVSGVEAAMRYLEECVRAAPQP